MKCQKCQADNPPTSKFCAECATPLPAAAGPGFGQTETLQTPVRELTTGSTFAGRYQIIEELGRGGMGKVYKVHDTDIKENVALRPKPARITRNSSTSGRRPTPGLPEVEDARKRLSIF